MKLHTHFIFFLRWQDHHSFNAAQNSDFIQKLTPLFFRISLQCKPKIVFPFAFIIMGDTAVLIHFFNYILQMRWRHPKRNNSALISQRTRIKMGTESYGAVLPSLQTGEVQSEYLLGPHSRFFCQNPKAYRLLPLTKKHRTAALASDLPDTSFYFLYFTENLQ